MTFNPIQALKCLCGFHDTYSKAGDLNFNFESLDLEDLTHDEIILLFFEMSATRCRHCDFIYSGVER